MSEFVPDPENLRRAIQWISEQRKDDPSLKLAWLVDSASKRFDLAPIDEEFLFRALTEPATPA